jgi:hypothetical protein
MSTQEYRQTNFHLLTVEVHELAASDERYSYRRHYWVHTLFGSWRVQHYHGLRYRVDYERPYWPLWDRADEGPLFARRRENPADFK